MGLELKFLGHDSTPARHYSTARGCGADNEKLLANANNLLLFVFLRFGR
jgi:hypothetical protein